MSTGLRSVSPTADRFVRLAVLVLALPLTLAGCVSNPPTGKAGAAADPVFYPAEPGAARIQHLATFTGERDVTAPEEGFAKFIAGD
ncbi:MAG: hypothetical protein JNM82_10510, partial [Rhodocyclaceae bacterium]|nr:hypothetical protein [Rhodocyclaceae bacterium]